MCLQKYVQITNDIETILLGGGFNPSAQASLETGRVEWVPKNSTNHTNGEMRIFKLNSNNEVIETINPPIKFQGGKYYRTGLSIGKYKFELTLPHHQKKPNPVIVEVIETINPNKVTTLP